MTDRRLEFQRLLESLLGSRNVYYDPPSTLKMNYPCIRYSLSGINTKHADDKKYLNKKQYDLIVISKKIDPEVVDKILELPYSSLNRPYPADNLHHYPITIYY